MDTRTEEEKMLDRIQTILNSMMTDKEKLRSIASIVIAKFKYDIKPYYLA